MTGIDPQARAAHSARIGFDPVAFPREGVGKETYKLRSDPATAPYVF